MTTDCSQVSLPDCPLQGTVYGYYPSLPANAFFCAWFGLFLVIGLIFGLRYKTWTYTLALILGCVTEVIGYVGRIMLHQNAYSTAGFQMQICCIILGPAFNSAALYLTLKHVALTFGSDYSIIKPAWYTYIFIACDLISLILQAIGGGIAATAGQDGQQQNLGTNIMIAGIVFQVAVLLLFGSAILLYTYRCLKAFRAEPSAVNFNAIDLLHDTKFRLFAAAASTAYLAIFCRCVYRIVEMAGGWANPVMRDEPSFIVLESAFIAYATGVQTSFHPGFCFPQMFGQELASPKVTEAAVEDKNSPR